MTLASPTTLEQPAIPPVACSDWLGRIVCGDNTEVLSGFPAECVDLVVTSPPYDDLRTYGGHSWNFETLAAQLVRVLKPGGVIVWVVADETKDGTESGTSMRQALHFQTLGLNLHDTMVYEKAGTGACGSNLAYWQTWEFMFVLAKGRPKAVNRLKTQNLSAGVKTTPRTVAIGNRDSDGVRVVEDEGVRANIWRYNVNKYGMENTGHPAPFPIALAKDHVASWSNPGDVILDPFAGSGTTLKAAKELNRQWCGIEINPEYCAMAEARLSQDVLQLEATNNCKHGVNKINVCVDCVRDNLRAKLQPRIDAYRESERITESDMKLIVSEPSAIAMRPNAPVSDGANVEKP